MHTKSFDKKKTQRTVFLIFRKMSCLVLIIYDLALNLNEKYLNKCRK